MSARWLVSALLVTACVGCDPSGARPVEQQTAATQSPAPRQDVVLVAAHEGSWSVLGADDGRVVDIEMTREESTIRFQEMTLRGEIRTGSRRYRYAGGRDFFVKVKRRGAKLLLKDRGAKLLWEVQIAQGRVDISEGESGQRSYAIVTNSGGGLDVTGEGKPLGSVSLEADAKRVSVSNVGGAELFWASATTTSALWGVLLMTDIPETHRYIIMAEIGARGR